MRQTLLIFCLLTGCVAGFVGYCAALIDWIQDYRQGVYARDPFEAMLETGAILIYSYAGVRFFKWRISA